MNEMWIFASCNDAFAPGVRALGRSIRANFPDAKFCVLAYGGDVDVGDVADRVVLDADLPVPGSVIKHGQNFRGGVQFSGGYAYSVSGPELYARLLVPELMQHRGRALYVDADCLVLRDMAELWLLPFNGNPTACVSRKTIGWASDPDKRWQDMASGVFMIDCAEWGEQDITQKHFVALGKQSA